MGAVACFVNCVPGLRAMETTNDAWGPMFSATEEDDLFSNPFTNAHSDRYYTQGLKLLYLGGDNDTPGWVKKTADAIPAWGIHVQADDFGYMLGQDIYTPVNLQASSLISTDRPYGGWLYTGVVLQRRGTVGDLAIPVMEDFEVNLGITGRPSLAEAAQENFHRWFFPKNIPHGWHNQLKTEPGLLLKYQRLWRLTLNDASARYIDLIPHAGGEVGNIMVFGNLGGALRAGYNLPPDFGVQINDSPASATSGMSNRTPPFSAYLFGAVDGRYVAHNLFLDGNTFQGGPSVTRNPWVADIAVGGAIRLFKHLELDYTRVIRTPEFQGQNGIFYFGSLTAKLMFNY